MSPVKINFILSLSATRKIQKFTLQKKKMIKGATFKYCRISSTDARVQTTFLSSIIDFIGHRVKSQDTVKKEIVSKIEPFMH